jgi:hypothetical protein
VDEPKKTVSDHSFAEEVLSEHAHLQRQDGLTAAERAGVRELLGFLADLREIVANERFQKEAWTRVGGVRDRAKAWALAGAAFLGLLTAAFTIFKQF